MFLELAHQKLDVYSLSLDLVIECYQICKLLPGEERFAMGSQIRRAAVSVHLNIAEGSSRKSEAERKRFYEMARGSVVEVDAAFDIAVKLNFVEQTDFDRAGPLLKRTYSMLTGMIRQG